MKTFLAAFAAFLILTCSAPAQVGAKKQTMSCGSACNCGSLCPSSGGPCNCGASCTCAYCQNGPTWVRVADAPQQIALYQNGKQVGSYSYASRCYRSFDGKTWGEPQNCAPAGCSIPASIESVKAQPVRLIQPLQRLIGGCNHCR
jgi:hypothetical protein